MPEIALRRKAFLLRQSITAGGSDGTKYFSPQRAMLRTEYLSLDPDKTDRRATYIGQKSPACHARCDQIDF
jgi:hypothetical protein